MSPSARSLTLLQSELVRKLCGATFLGESSPTLGIDSQVPCLYTLYVFLVPSCVMQSVCSCPPQFLVDLPQECIVKISVGSRAAIRLWDTSASGSQLIYGCIAHRCFLYL